MFHVEEPADTYLLIYKYRCFCMNLVVFIKIILFRIKVECKAFFRTDVQMKPVLKSPETRR